MSFNERLPIHSRVWNVCKSEVIDGLPYGYDLMLGMNVTHRQAAKWARYYRETYSGKPYPNGKGHYPDWEFWIVRRHL